MPVFRKLAACVFAAGLLSGAARPDLPSFNRAVLASDYNAAATAAASTWGTIDRNRPEIAVIAREFAWMSMLADRPVEANTYTTFLTSTLGLKDPTPNTSRVLHAWAGFRLNDTPETRSAFLSALQASQAAPGLDLVALAAANALAAAGDSSALAIANDLRTRRAPLAKQRGAELVAIINAFGERREPSSYLSMIQLDQALHGEALNPAYADIRQQLFDLHDQAWAWRIVMESVLRASRKPYPLADVQHDEDLTRRYPAPRGTMPQCPGELRKEPDVKFPFRERKDAISGAVIVAFSINAQGQTFNERILVSVPEDSGYNTAVLEAVRQWTFVPAQGVDPSTCTLARDHNAIAMQFGFKGPAL